MITMKFIQLIGNMIVRDLMTRYPLLTIRFFAGKSGSRMRVFIAFTDDPQQLTGRLFDIGATPPLETLKVKDLAALLERRIGAEVRAFLRTRSGG